MGSEQYGHTFADDDEAHVEVEQVIAHYFVLEIPSLRVPPADCFSRFSYVVAITYLSRCLLSQNILERRDESEAGQAILTDEVEVNDDGEVVLSDGAAKGDGAEDDDERLQRKFVDDDEFKQQEREEETKRRGVVSLINRRAELVRLVCTLCSQCHHSLFQRLTCCRCRIAGGESGRCQYSKAEHCGAAAA